MADPIDLPADLSFRPPIPLPSVPVNVVDLPEPAPDLTAPPGGARGDYFDPERWDAEIANYHEPDERDPVAHDRGRLDGRGTAALFLSDFHLADGSAGGDDFLESHLLPDRTLGGLYTGFFPPGGSRAGLVLRVLTFARQRVREQAGDARLDVVLAGDIVNALELKGRGGTFVSDKHTPLFAGLAALAPHADVYWLRGNHDYVVPGGPWRAGEFYVNEALRVLAEHGDFWDKENWPPGPASKGSRFVIEAASAFEVRASVLDGAIKYLMSGVDNIRPLSSEAVSAFLERRGEYSDVAWLAAQLARLKFDRTGDDAASYKGARERRRKGKYQDWLMVQGHTHIPAAVPETYYNLGSWITTLVAPEGEEAHVEAFPFLLVYQDTRGRRVEEYYLTGGSVPGDGARAALQTVDSVRALRQVYGYPADVG